MRKGPVCYVYYAIKEKREKNKKIVESTQTISNEFHNSKLPYLF